MPFLVDLDLAWDLLRQVIIPLPIGFFEFIDNCKIELNVDLEINSKCGVCPLITQPKAIKLSYLFKYFEIVTGISKIPLTLIILYLIFFFLFFLIV